MADVAMPRLSDSMEEGTILRWLKADGDEVARGDELVEIETDKANMTYEADQDGVLEVVAGEGDTLPVGELIARIGSGGSANGAARAPEEEREEPEPPEREPPAAAGDGDGDGGDRVRASPVARRIARDRGVDLEGIEGSGPGGRIVKADLEERGPEPGRPAPAEKATTGKAKGEGEVVELTRAQLVVARRMAESRATVPDFTLTAEVDMAAAHAAREDLRELGDPLPSFNDLVVRAAALALREFPRANGSYRDGAWELHSRVNVGVAVAAEGSLVVPTVFDADRKGLGELADETRTLADKVREGRITPPELAGGTFTVSNLGMHGVTSFSAVINPPQAAVLAVGAVREVPVVRNGLVVPGRTMGLTLACDHRILYGAEAAAFLAAVVTRLEHPLALAI